MAQFYNGVFYKNDIDAKQAKLENEGGNATQFFNYVGDELWNAGKNWWYTVTGQTHKTDAYQYEQGLADTAYQRAAADMEAAGLSKFGGVTPAGTPSTKNGSDLLSTAIALQQLKNDRLEYKEQKYNFNKAKKWGVPTSAVGEFAKYDAACKMIFGKSVTEMVGDDGLFGMLKDWFEKNFGFGNAEDSVPTSAAGAVTDAVQHVNGDASPILEPVYVDPLGMFRSKVYKPAPFELPKLIDNPETFELDIEPFSESYFKKTSDSESFTKILGGSVMKDVDVHMKKMLNDDMLNDQVMYNVAFGMSKRYNVNVEDVLSYMHHWIAENDGEVIYRW